MSKQAIVRAVDALLKPKGFVRHGSVWNRRAGDCVQVIDLQTSKVGGSLTVNAGVLDPEVYRTLWDKEPAAVVKEPYCTVRARVGTLVDDYDLWWPLDHNEIPAQIVETMTNYVVPFVHRVSSREMMVQWLKDTNVVAKRDAPSILSLAILQHFLGQASEARVVLEEFQKKVLGAWREGVAEVTSRLGYK
jgi:hypothetical protein